MKKAKDVDSYIASAPEAIRDRLVALRRVIREAAPNATERISYGIPFYEYGGTGYKGRLVYFAAFKNHIGFYPPVRGDARLEKAVAPYAGAKGNLKFPLDRPIPYTLIERIVKHRVKQNRAKAAAKNSRKP